MKGHIILSILFIFSMTFFSAIAQQDETPTHEVSVEAKIIPLFAIDESGKPAVDLSQDDFRVYIDNVEIPIAAFKHFQILENQSNAPNAKADEPTKSQPIAVPERTVFIIVDTVFNSRNGLKRSRDIMRQLVENLNGNDSFVLLENSAGGGLKHLLGPDNRKNEVLDFINKYRPQQEIWIKKLFAKNDLTNIEGGGAFRGFRSNDRQIEIMRYRNAIKRLTESIAGIKYALKTIDQAKLTFLVSEGPANQAFIENTDLGPSKIRTTESFKLYLYRYLQNMATSVNKGGSILFTINPQTINKAVDTGSSGENGLRFMASHGGGQYFAGSQTGQMIRQISRATTAYYEIFVILPKGARDMKFDLKCLRKGVKINTLGHIERDSPYLRMEPVQKKVFVVNAVTGGHWTRMAATISEIGFKVIANQESTGAALKKIQVSLPPEFGNRSLDFFRVTMDPATNETDIEFETSVAGDTKTFSMRTQKYKHTYFAIIEPTGPVCLFNQVK